MTLNLSHSGFGGMKGSSLNYSSIIIVSIYNNLLVVLFKIQWLLNLECVVSGKGATGQIMEG